MKQAIRAIDEVSAPAKTSQQHFYSEPKSILATEPLLSPEQLQELIREHGQESRPNSSLNMQREDTQLQQEMMMQQQQQYQQTTTVQESSMSSSMRQETYCREREEDSQAPPDLEPVALQHQPAAEMVGQQESYEPSADELIDVLKNLENLAAANPALYKSLVGQIKGNAVESHQSFSSNEQQVYYEQQQPGVHLSAGVPPVIHSGVPAAGTACVRERKCTAGGSPETGGGLCSGRIS